MSSPFVAEIRILANNFPPNGWAFCNGQILPISQNTALFSLLGTMYGGNGQSTFALPNLQGSAPLGQGQKPGFSEYFIGQQAGTETVTLLQSEMPAHNHIAQAAVDAGDIDAPSPSESIAKSNNGSLFIVSNAGIQPMNFQVLSVAGSSFPHNNMMPYLTLNFCIALQGIFPPRP